MDLLTKKELAKAYNILIDLECCMTWQAHDEDHIKRLNDKFYRCVPHVDLCQESDYYRKAERLIMD